MTLKEREDRFIERCKEDFKGMTFESESLLRYGFMTAAEELSRVAYADGMQAQRTAVLDALGASPWKRPITP